MQAQWIYYEPVYKIVSVRSISTEVFFEQFIFAVVVGLVKDNYYKTRLDFLQAYVSMWH